MRAIVQRGIKKETRDLEGQLMKYRDFINVQWVGARNPMAPKAA